MIAEQAFVHPDNGRGPLEKLMAEAESFCIQHGQRFTAPRRAVLDVILAHGQPIGAYDIIRKMPAGTKPPTVYRALDFWEDHGFVHRISSLNLYAACHAGHRHPGSQYMVCQSCGHIAEIHLCHLPEPLQEKVKAAGFSITRWNTELHGLCADCGGQ